MRPVDDHPVIHVEWDPDGPGDSVGIARVLEDYRARRHYDVGMPEQVQEGGHRELGEVGIAVPGHERYPASHPIRIDVDVGEAEPLGLLLYGLDRRQDVGPCISRIALDLDFFEREAVDRELPCFCGRLVVLGVQEMYGQEGVVEEAHGLAQVLVVVAGDLIDLRLKLVPLLEHEALEIADVRSRVPERDVPLLEGGHEALHLLADRAELVREAFGNVGAEDVAVDAARALVDILDIEDRITAPALA